MDGETAMYKIKDIMKTSLSVLVLSGLLVAGSLADAQTEKAPALSQEAEAGRSLYNDWCAGCHGADGLGDGPAADYLDPRPRNFVDGAFKIRNTVSGELPTDEDIFKMIDVGMPGSSMPGWKKQFSEKQIHQLVAYIKTLIDMEFFGEEIPEKITVGEPLPSSAESLAKGKELYRKLKCWECHGEEGRGDGPSAPTLKDDWGNPIISADITKGWTFRGGNHTFDIYRTFTTGLDGTPMPSYIDTIGDEDRWHLSNYVKSLSPLEMPPVKTVLTSRRIKGEIPGNPDDPIWRQGEDYFFPLAGQIVFEPRLYTPSIDSILIKSVYNDKEVAFLITWNDRTRNAPEKGKDELPDSMAIQFPVELKDERPHFVLGDAGNPVNLWKWKAGGDTLEEANARGVGKYFPQGPESQGLKGDAAYMHGRWKLIVKRSLTTEEENNDIQFVPGEFIPISFLAWDGSNNEAGGKMSLSSWYYLVLEKPVTARAFIFTPLAILGAVGLEFLAMRRARRGARSRN